MLNILLTGCIYIKMRCSTAKSIIYFYRLSKVCTKTYEGQKAEFAATCRMSAVLPGIAWHCVYNRGHAPLFLFSFCHGLNLFVQKT